MGYRTEILLGCIGLNLITDIILWTYTLYSPKHIGLRIAVYIVAVLFAWLSEEHDPFKCFNWLINALRNRHTDGRRRYLGNLILSGEVRGKAKVIRIHSHRGLR